MVHSEFARQRIILFLQTTVIAVILAYLTVRAAAILLGPTAAVVVLVIAVLYTYRNIRHAHVAIPAQAAPFHGMIGLRLREAVDALSTTASLPFAPSVYRLPTELPVAFTSGYGTRAVIVLSDGLLRFVPWRGVRAVLAHEIAHLQHHDLELFAITSVLQGISRLSAFVASVTVMLFFPVLLTDSGPEYLMGIVYLSAIPIVTLLLVFAFSRTREYGADLGAVELGVEARDLAEALSIIDRYINLIDGHQPTETTEYLRTHPPTQKRIQRLKRIQPMTSPRYTGYNRAHAYQLGRITPGSHWQRRHHSDAVW